MCASFVLPVLLLLLATVGEGTGLDIGSQDLDLPTILNDSCACACDELFKDNAGKLLRSVFQSNLISLTPLQICCGHLVFEEHNKEKYEIEVEFRFQNESTANLSNPILTEGENGSYCIDLSMYSSSSSFVLCFRIQMQHNYTIPVNATVKCLSTENVTTVKVTFSKTSSNCKTNLLSDTSPKTSCTTPETTSPDDVSITFTIPASYNTWSEGSAVRNTSLGSFTNDTAVSASGNTTLYVTTSSLDPTSRGSSSDGVNQTTPSSSSSSASSTLTTTTSPTTTASPSTTASTSSSTITSLSTTSPPTSASTSSSSFSWSSTSSSLTTTSTTITSSSSTTSSSTTSSSSSSPPLSSSTSTSTTTTSTSSSPSSSSSSATTSTTTTPTSSSPSSSSSSATTSTTTTPTSSSPSSSSSSSTISTTTTSTSTSFSSSTTTTSTKRASTPSKRFSSSALPSSSSTSTSDRSTNPTNTTQSTTDQTVAATTTSQRFFVKIDPIRLANEIYTDDLEKRDNDRYRDLHTSVYERLVKICTSLFENDFVNVSSIAFSRGSVIVDTTLEFNRNLTDTERVALNKAIQNGFSETVDIVAVVVGSVVGFLFIFICILLIIFFVRWRHKKRQRRLRPEPAEPEPEIAGGTFPLQRPQTLLWQSSVATSSLSRRAGQSGVIELSTHGLEGGESYIGTDDGSGPKKHMADTIRARNGIRDPALRHYGDATSDAGPRTGRLTDATDGAVGRVWNGAIPRPELDKSRFYQLRQHEGSVFEAKNGKAKVANGYEVKRGQGPGTPTGPGIRKKEEELGSNHDRRRGRGLEGGLGAGGQEGGGLRAGGLGGLGVRRLEGGGYRGEGLRGGGVGINLWETSDSRTTGSDQAISNLTPNPLFLNDPPFFAGLAPVFQNNRSPSPFDRSLPIPVAPGANRVEQRPPATFEGLFVPTMTFGRHSDSSEGSSTRHLLPPLVARTTGGEGGPQGLHQPGRTLVGAGHGESTFDDALLNDVLTLHGAKQKTQNGFLSRLQGSLSRTRTKPDNIHRTPTRTQMKARHQLSLANGAANGMY